VKKLFIRYVIRKICVSLNFEEKKMNLESTLVFLYSLKSSIFKKLLSINS